MKHITATTSSMTRLTSNGRLFVFSKKELLDKSVTHPQSFEVKHFKPTPTTAFFCLPMDKIPFDCRKLFYAINKTLFGSNHFEMCILFCKIFACLKLKVFVASERTDSPCMRQQIKRSHQCSQGINYLLGPNVLCRCWRLGFCLPAVIHGCSIRGGGRTQRSVLYVTHRRLHGQCCCS